MFGFRRLTRRPCTTVRAILGLQTLEERWNPAQFKVTNAADAGEGSLRAAVLAAEGAGAGSHLIFFEGDEVAADQLIILTTQIDINADVTIRGPVPGQYQSSLSIEGRNIGTGEERTGNRVFKIAAGKTVAIENLRMSNGAAVGSDKDGGIIRVDAGASFTLRNSTVSYGFAAGDGGGIWVGDGGTLLISASTVMSSEATRNGGGVAMINPVSFTSARVMGVSPSVIENRAGNTGGGIWLTGSRRANTPSVSLTDLGANTNVAVREGGGIHFTWTGGPHNTKPIQLENCSFDSNVSEAGHAAGAWISGDARVTGGTIRNNRARFEPVSHLWTAGRVEEVGTVERGGNTVQAPPLPNDDPQCAGYIASDAEVVAIGELKYDGGLGPEVGFVSATTLRNAGILYPSDSSDPHGLGEVTIGGSYDQVGTGTLSIDMTGGGADQLVVTGAANLVKLAGALDLHPHWTTPPTYGTVYTIIKNDTDQYTSGTFDGRPDGYEFWLDGAKFRINYGVYTGDFNDVILTVIGTTGVRGRVATDGNGNGIFEPLLGETVLAGVQVELLDEYGQAVTEPVTTDAFGRYAFGAVKFGDYQVRFTRPTDLRPVLPGAGDDEYADSDYDYATLTAGVTIDEANPFSDPYTDALFRPLIAVNDYTDVLSGGTIGGDVRLNDPPADGDTLTFSHILESGPAFGVLQFYADGTFVYFAPVITGPPVVVTFQYLVTDSYGHTAVATVSIIVHPQVNQGGGDPPPPPP